MEKTMKIEQVAVFRCCLTCVHRKPYPAATRSGEPVFSHFMCGLALDSNRELVRPEECCPCWKGAALNPRQ